MFARNICVAFSLLIALCSTTVVGQEAPRAPAPRIEYVDGDKLIDKIAAQLRESVEETSEKLSKLENFSEAVGELTQKPEAAALVKKLASWAEAGQPGDAKRFCGVLYADARNRDPATPRLPEFSGNSKDVTKPFHFEKRDVRIPFSEELVDKLADVFAEGLSDTAANLSRLGFEKELNEVLSIDGVKMRNVFSSYSLIESLYRRARATSEREGQRFLAKLYYQAENELSAALSEDVDFNEFRKFSPEELRTDIKFSSIETVDVTKEIPKSVDTAISKLSVIYGGKSVGTIRATLRRHLRRDGFSQKVVDGIFHDSRTTKEALVRVFDAGTPPPSLEAAVEGVLRETIAKQGSLIDDTELRRVVDDLSKELPENLERYVTKEGELQSRQRQLAEAERFRSVGRHDPYRGPSDGPFSQDSPFGPSAPISGGGVTRSVSNSRHAGYSEKSHSTPRQSVSGKGGRAASSRSYSRGIRSARLARGIAIGGKLEIDVPGKPTSAYWFPNQKDRRFGRLFVKLETGSTAVSRVMFTDSFMASVDLIQSKSGRESELHEDELLILMSMAPESDWVGESKKLREFEQKLKFELFKQLFKQLLANPAKYAELVKENDAQQLAMKTVEGSPKLRREYIALVEELASIKGTVLHPALFGTELGWSSVRVDFSFRDINALTEEASLLSDSPSIVLENPQLKKLSADTWQFFEFNHTIKSEETNQNGVLSIWSQATSIPDSSNDTLRVPKHSHFGVSMFSYTEIEGTVAMEGEEGVYRLPKLEREVQPLLDWLSDKHHDFIRLNDFAESLSFVRWLGREDTTLTIIDLNGREPALLTPDRITAEGPKAGD